MATLQNTSLIDCLYIPDFISSGAKMIFENSNAPTSWTKDTTYNNSTLRIVSGSVTNGGSTAFATVLTSRTFTGTVSSIQSGIVLGQVIPTITMGPTTVTGTVAQVLASPPPHSHPYVTSSENQRAVPGPAAFFNRKSGLTQTAGLSGQHNHSWGPWTHNHTNPNPSSIQHSHPLTETSHNHQDQVSGSQDFSVYYKDVILATKD